MYWTNDRLLKKICWIEMNDWISLLYSFLDDLLLINLAAYKINSNPDHYSEIITETLSADDCDDYHGDDDVQRYYLQRCDDDDDDDNDNLQSGKLQQMRVGAKLYGRRYPPQVLSVVIMLILINSSTIMLPLSHHHHHSFALIWLNIAHKRSYSNCSAEAVANRSVSKVESRHFYCSWEPFW